MSFLDPSPKDMNATENSPTFMLAHKISNGGLYVGLPNLQQLD